MTLSTSVIHTVAGLHPSSGGTSRVVVELTDALAIRSPIDITVVTQSCVGEPVVPSLTGKVRRVIATSGSHHALKFGWPFRLAMIKERGASLIHNHGVWLPVNHWASQFALSRNIPFIVQPHGTLEPWALGQKAWKKRLAMTVFQRRDLEKAQAFVATADTELQSIRKLGFRQPIAIIPNGIMSGLGSVSYKPQQTVASRVRTVLFLSRIHPKKGVLNLVHAWSQIPHGGWQLSIAGPDEGGHLKEVLSLANQLNIGGSFKYLGELEGTRKAEAYEGADLFVLPTFSENFGVVVAEALAYGVPVITTWGAPWGALVSHGCGWWVETGIDPLKQALCDAMALDDSERWAMGVRGQDYVRCFAWELIADQTLGLYRWLLGQGPKPALVHSG